MQVTINIEARRAYILGNTYPIKDQLKNAGAHWDADRKAWWISSAKSDAIASLISSPAAATAQQTDRLDYDRKHILGRAKYSGHSYYLVGEGSNDRGSWVRLMFRDGSKTFFKAAGEVEIARYQSVKTLDDLRAYAERMKQEQADGECHCRYHDRSDCTCPGFCRVHFDGCEYCGCEND